MNETSFFKNAVIVRRRALLPLWIKISTWIFLIIGVGAILALALGFALKKPSLFLYGMETDAIYSVKGITILLLLIFKGIVAYGLWFEKNWAPATAIIDALTGLVFCIYMLFIKPFVLGDYHFTIRLELVPLIPYLVIMKKIQRPWANAAKPVIGYTRKG